MAELYKEAFKDEDLIEFSDEEILNNKKSFRKRLIFALIFIVVTVAFSFFSVVDKSVDSIVMPMNISVMLSGFICGGPLGFVVGLVAPLIRFLIYSQAPFSQTVFTCLELAFCGCMSGYLYRAMPKKILFVVPNVIVSFLLSKVTFYTLNYCFNIFWINSTFNINRFIEENLLSLIFGVVLQIIIMPIIVAMFRFFKIGFDE